MSTNSFITELQNINLLNGCFVGVIKFQNGLNIISGENGTGKTKLLQQIKSGQKVFANGNSNQIVIFNPKRNAEKQNLDHFAKKLRSQGLNAQKINQTLNQQNINDGSFLPYSSFGELFILSYEALTEQDDGGVSKRDAIETIKNDFNAVLQRVFPGYEIVAEWKAGRLILNIKKNGNISMPVEGLSCGESEVLSLIFNIYANRERQDIYLIDEPEVHLNWSLEQGLFNFMHWFCEEFGKQIITATHSRILFQEEFLQKTQFLVWNNGKVLVQKDITDEMKSKIAGDAIKIISALDLNSKTFFVEDEAHARVVTEIAKLLEKDIGAIKLGSCSNVKSFCKAAEKENMQNAYFLVDGDNQGVDSDLQSSAIFIHLKKYCIQNYLLQADILAEISNPVITADQVNTKIKECIRGLKGDQRNIVFKKLAEVSDEIPDEVLDTFDASKITNELAKKIGLKDEV